MHNFLTEQPDLNFHCAEVQDALLDVVRYWLARGGRRASVSTRFNFYFHDRLLRDNPPLDQEARNDKTAPSVNPYNFQDHLYDKTQSPRTSNSWRRFRAVCDEFEAITSVGEVGESHRGARGAGRPIRRARAVAHVLRVRPSVERLSHRVMARRGDDTRLRTRRGLGLLGLFQPRRCAPRQSLELPPVAQKCYCCSFDVTSGDGLSLSGRGTRPHRGLCRLRGPPGPLRHPVLASVSGAVTAAARRCPGATTRPTGGFSDTKPWLPVAVEHLEQAVDLQDRDPSSMLSFYRAMVAFRKGAPDAAEGQFRSGHGHRRLSRLHARSRGAAALLRVQPVAG